jgi:multimeric flavodoxin WrbA
MKILALAGSPRKKGNSDLLTEAFLDGAKSKGGVTEKVYLNDLAMRGCQACYACVKSGRCKQRDDMTGLYDKLLAADLWVLATPVYWWGPSAQLKLALDRMFCLCHGPSRALLKGKTAVLIAAFEDVPKEATPFLVGMVKKACGYVEMDLAGKILVQASQKGEVVEKDPAALITARNLGARPAGRGERAGRPLLLPGAGRLTPWFYPPWPPARDIRNSY